MATICPRVMIGNACLFQNEGKGMQLYADEAFPFPVVEVLRHRLVVHLSHPASPALIALSQFSSEVLLHFSSRCPSVLYVCDTGGWAESCGSTSIRTRRFRFASRSWPRSFLMWLRVVWKLAR